MGNLLNTDVLKFQLPKYMKQFLAFQSQNVPSAQAALDSQNGPSAHSSFVQYGPVVDSSCVQMAPRNI